ncbi:MAG TPA: hypothetical protein VFH51_08615 [Myxococcota bacterium]|nr:hypothetical protein [Myxococcota bacterium]
MSVALWLGFGGLMLRALGGDTHWIRHVGRFMFDLCAVILMTTGLTHWLQSEQLGVSHVSGSFYWNVAVAACAAVTGAVRGNTALSWTLLGLLPFGCMLCIALGSLPGLFERILKTLVHQLYIGVAFALYVLIYARPHDRLEWNGIFGDGLPKLAARSIYGLPFVAPYIGRLKFGHAVLVLSAYVAYFMLHVLGANRGGLIISAVALPGLLAVLYWRAGRQIGSPSTAARAAVVLVLTLGPLISLAAASRPALADYLGARVQESIGRLAGGETDDLQNFSTAVVMQSEDEFLGTESRGGELRDFLSQLGPLDYVTGRGFGGSWLSTYWGVEWQMVHIGFAHLILVGGVPLLLAFLAMVAQGLRNLWNALAARECSAGAFCYIIVYLMGFTQHGALQDENELFLFWLCCGIGLANPQPRRSPPHYAPSAARAHLSRLWRPWRPWRPGVVQA